MALSPSEKSAIFHKLVASLDHECRIYEKYIKVINEEQLTVSKLSLERMKVLTAERENLLMEMTDSQNVRRQLVTSLGEGSHIKLSDAVKKHYAKDAAIQLNRRIDLLRKLVKHSQGLSAELNQIVSFSQRIANGCLAIFASAKNNVFRSYSPYGKIKEAYHPSNNSRDSKRV